MIRLALLSMLMGPSLFACATVTPGTAVVKVDVCGTQEESTRYSVVKGGRVIDGPCTDYYWLPVREQRAVWDQAGDRDESISFSGVDGQPLNVDVAVTYLVDPADAQVIKMVRTYGPELEHVIGTRVRDSVRDSLNMCAAAGSMSVQDIYGEKKGELFTCVEDKVEAQYQANGLLITSVTLNSQVRLPEKVAEAMEGAQAATQKADQARREVESTKAEGEKRVAAAQADAEAVLTKARAEAEANEIVTRSLTPAVLQLRQLEIELEKAEKWNGALPTTVLGGQTQTLLDLR